MEIATLEKQKNLNLISDETYNVYIRQFNKYLEDNHLPLHIESILSYLDESKDFYSIRSMGVIKAALKKAIEETYVNTPYYLQFSHGVDKAFSKIKIGKADIKIHSEDILQESEIDILLSGNEWYDARQKKTIFVKPDLDLFYLIQFLKETGMRISELICLEKNIFQVKGDFAYYSFIGKGKKERKNFVLASLLDEIKTHYSIGNIYLFDFRGGSVKYSDKQKEEIRKWISHKLNSYSRKVIGREINPHDFRHYFATRLLKEGKSLKAIAQWLGHSSTSITSDMYVHDELSPDDLY